MNWIDCNDELPKLKDDSVLVHFDNGAIEAVHIEDYFKDITNGMDANGKQLYTKWYLNQGVSHWVPLPAPPEQKE